MKTLDVVALTARETGYNSPHEFVIAAVDERGVLHQFGGVDDAIAAEVIGICEHGVSLVVLHKEEQLRGEILADHTRGDVPESMPRHTMTSEQMRSQRGTNEAPAHKPLGMGQQPVHKDDDAPVQ